MNTITIDNTEYRQSSQYPKIYIAKNGSYIIPESKNPEKIRTGTKMFNSKGYPLCVELCTTIPYQIDDKIIAKRVVVNIGRIVLEVWKNEFDENLEVDHIDRNPFNNNIENLRLVTKLENMKNTKRYKGITKTVFKEKKKSEKLSFDEKYRQHLELKKISSQKRHIITLQQRLELYKEKQMLSPNNNRSHAQFDKYTRKIKQLESEIQELSELLHTK